MKSLIHSTAQILKANPLVSRSPFIANSLKSTYTWILKVLYSKRGMPIALGEDSFRVVIESRTMVSSYVTEKKVYQFLAQRIHKGMIIFDIGANEGVYTLCAAKRVGTEGRVCSFEPSPKALKFLQQNVRLNGFSDRVKIVPVLVSDTSGQARFYVSGQSGYNLMRREAAPADAEVFEVPSVTIDGFSADRYLRPDIVKIDVEGAELQVLHGMQSLMNSHNLIIICEVHFDLLRYFGSSEQEIIESVKRTGYKVYDLQMKRLDKLAPHVVFAR